MELQDAKNEEVRRYKLDCTPEEEETLRKIAIRRFAKDEQAQLEYAVRTIIGEVLDTLGLESLEEENGNKNNNRK